MQKIKKSAFTLVELIVVITILAILWTIAFISLQWYSRDARDATRTADLWNIKTSLELFSLKTWKYPSPDNFSTITYSGWTEDVWYQWVVWDIVTTNLKSLNEKPLDPLTNDPYTYSVTNSYKEYEVLALYEWSVAYNPIINQTNAATTTLTPKIVWNYNWVFVRTNNYIIPTPSIVIAEPLLTWTPLPLTSSNIKSLVMTNGINIPKNSLTQTNTWNLNINLKVYTWSITSSSSTWAMISAVQQIQQAYTWTTISTQENIAYILNQTTNDQLIALWNITILKGSKPLTILPPSPPLYPSCTWSGQIKTSTNIYGLCDTQNIIVCSWNGTWYEISACDVWTNTIWTRWWYFQWWNNADLTSASTTTIQFPDTTSYQPSTFSNPIFIINNWPNDWTSQQNDNLWWDTTDTNIARKWPCRIWYHIPSQGEWVELYSLLWSSPMTMISTLFMPLTGYKYWYDWGINATNSDIYYWSSSPDINNIKYAKHINMRTSFFHAIQNSRTYGFAVRCFKN